MATDKKDGPPVRKGRRHEPTTTATVSRPDDMRAVLLAAAEMVDDVDGQRGREAGAYRLGYRDGFVAGEVVGAQRAEREIVAEWEHVAEHVHGLANMPAHAELKQRRAVPGGDAYFAALVRNGGLEFAGVGRPRVPAPPGAYERALSLIEAAA